VNKLCGGSTTTIVGPDNRAGVPAVAGICEGRRNVGANPVVYGAAAVGVGAGGGVISLMSLTGSGRVDGRIRGKMSVPWCLCETGSQ